MSPDPGGPRGVASRPAPDRTPRRSGPGPSRVGLVAVALLAGARRPRHPQRGPGILALALLAVSSSDALGARTALAPSDPIVDQPASTAIAGEPAVHVVQAAGPDPARSQLVRPARWPIGTASHRP